MKTNHLANLQAAGSYLTSAVRQLDQLDQMLHARNTAQPDVLVAQASEVAKSLTRYLVNLQSALEINQMITDADKETR